MKNFNQFVNEKFDYEYSFINGKKIDSSFSSLYSSDYELSIQGSFDVKGNNMLDINSYQKWCMRRSIQNGSYEYMTTLLSIVSHEKKDEKETKIVCIVICIIVYVF